MIINGLYNYVDSNKEFICNVLEDSIEKDSIPNYKKYDVFDIHIKGVFSPREDKETLVVRTKVPGPSYGSSQGHCMISTSDDINYINIHSTSVMNIIISLFRDYKLNKLLDK